MFIFSASGPLDKKKIFTKLNKQLKHERMILPSPIEGITSIDIVNSPKCYDNCTKHIWVIIWKQKKNPLYSMIKTQYILYVQWSWCKIWNLYTSKSSSLQYIWTNHLSFMKITCSMLEWLSEKTWKIPLFDDWHPITPKRKT